MTDRDWRTRRLARALLLIAAIMGLGAALYSIAALLIDAAWGGDLATWPAFAAFVTAAALSSAASLLFRSLVRRSRARHQRMMRLYVSSTEPSAPREGDWWL